MTERFLENIIREISGQFQSLYERHIELLVILMTSVIVALLVNILVLPLQIIVKKTSLILNVSKGTVYMILTILLLLCIFSISSLYLSKPITFVMTTFLLVNRDLGIVYPMHPSVEYSIIGTDILQAYLRDIKAPLSLNDQLIRDLLEVFIVDWLISTMLYKTEVLSGFSRPKIKYPKFGKHYKVLRPQDILTKFGENKFTKYLDERLSIMPSSIKLPEKLSITCRRYENEPIKIEPDEEPAWVRYASELQIEASPLTPLKNFRIVVYPTKIAPGEPLLLRLEYNCKHVALEPDKIECINKNGKHIIISSEERKKLSSWTEIDFGIAISAEIKPYLFLHPKFRETLTWLSKLYLRAIDYFTPKLKLNT